MKTAIGKIHNFTILKVGVIFLLYYLPIPKERAARKSMVYRKLQLSARHHKILLTCCSFLKLFHIQTFAEVFSFGRGVNRRYGLTMRN
jgi:hypothetical protein